MAIDEFFFHNIIYVSVAGESFIAFLVVAEGADKVGVFDLFIEIADEGASGEMATCDFIDRTILFCPGSWIKSINIRFTP